MVGVGILDGLTGGGVDWRVELEDDGDLLPGRATRGHVEMTVDDDIDARGLVATLVGTEQWQYAQADRNGMTHTVTRHDELPRVPIRLLGPTRFGAGRGASVDFTIPVPALGPASFEGTVSRLSWELEIGLDVPGLDRRISVPVRILQPTALLRAGVLDLPQFALYPSADAADGDIAGSIALDPVPLCPGRPFSGSVTIAPAEALELQEIRLEIVVHAHATVSSGLSEDLTLWAGRIAEPVRLEGRTTTPFEVSGVLAAGAWPSSRLLHGSADAKVRVVLARPWARDAHLERDVAVCTTLEI
jgi:hypothetical protein